VLIYFERATAARIARRLFAALAEGGWLVPGPCDPALACPPGIEMIATAAGLAYRRRPEAAVALGPAPAPLAEPTRPLPLGLRQTGPQGAGEPGSPAAPEAPVPDEALSNNALRQIERLAAQGDIAGAEAAAVRATAADPFLPRLHFLRALLLVELGRYGEAESVMRRVLYLDPSLGFGHLTLGTILQRRGKICGAQRAYRNARTELQRLSPADTVPLSEGARAGDLIAAAESCLRAMPPAVFGAQP